MTAVHLAKHFAKIEDGPATTNDLPYCFGTGRNASMNFNIARTSW